jgi:hypothetical protein
LFEIWQKRYYNWFQICNSLDAAFSTACLFTTCNSDWNKVGYMPHILATSYVVWREIGQMLYLLTTLYGHWRKSVILCSAWNFLHSCTLVARYSSVYIVYNWIILCFNMSTVEKRVFMFVFLFIGIMLVMVVTMQLKFMYVEYVKIMWLNYNIAW